MLDRLLMLSDRHGHNDLSFECEICIEIKSLKEKIQQAIDISESLKIEMKDGKISKQPLKEIIEKAEKYDKIPEFIFAKESIFNRPIKIELSKEKELQSQNKSLSEDVKKWKESSEGFRKELVEEHKVVMKLAEENARLKEELNRLKNV